MDYGAYLKRQKYWLKQASANGRGFAEFFCIIGRTVRLVAERATVSVRLRLGNRKRSRISASVKMQGNLVFFYTFQGDYTCNPKYICEELLKRNVPCEIIWSAGKIISQEKINEFPDSVSLVQEGSKEFYEALAAAHVWVVNSTEFLKAPMPKKKGQYMMQTWHGSLGIKRFGKEVIAGSDLAAACELSNSMTDVILSNSEFEDMVYRETYWRAEQIARWGHARNDILINEKERCASGEKIRSYFKIPPGTHIVLYAPTFRDDHLFDDYAIDHRAVLKSLSERFGGEWYMMVRFHPSVRKEAGKFRQDGDHIIDATQYPDIQELMAAADAAITDYSSWIFDFLLTRRPGFIFANDAEKYERSFYYPLTETPFPVAYDNAQLAANVSGFDEDLYLKAVESFLQQKGCMEDGKAAERATDKICNVLTFI